MIARSTRLGHLPEIGLFAKNDRENKLIALWRAFRAVGSPYVLPLGTPEDRVAILEEAMRKTFADPEFAPYFRKLVSEDPSPMDGPSLTKLITEMPRDSETTDTLKKFSGTGPLPNR
jgi:hypothetical protein